MKKKKERGLELMTGLLAGSILAMSEALAAAGVSAGQTDNFQDGTSAGWENGQSCNEDNISTGGPAGNGDGYIRVSSPAVRCGHTDSKLVTLNRTRWTGDYSGQGVKQISMDLKNFGSAALPIRIAIREGTGGSGTPGYCSTAVSVPNDGQWHNYSFSLDGSMSPINSPQPLATDLANVQELRILSSAQPSLSGDAISAQIGIDNITAKGAAPSISGQPQSQPSAHVGENISFSVTASSAPAASYQWSKNGAPLSNGGNISGATSSSLSLNNIQTSDSGSYDVVVSNPYGSTPSQTASLTVQAAAPTITSFGPLNPAVLPGQSVQFTVLASGTQPFTYEWQFNDQDIPNAPSQDTYTVSSLPANIGNYRVIVHNSAGQATSVESRPTLLSLLTVGPTLGGIVNPGSSAYSQGSRVTLTAMPYPGWAFTGWPGDPSGNANPLTITMDSAKSFQANFANPGNACFDVLSGVTHWWSGEGNANDLMGAAHGTASGVTYSAGNTGQAFNFNGDSAYLDLGNDAGTFKAYGFTIEFWIKVPSTITRQEEVLCKRSTCNLNTSFWDIYNDSSGHPIFEMVDDAGHHLSLPLSKAVNDGTWHYVVFARDGRTLYGYLDGLLDSTLDSGVHLNVSPGAALLAGTGPCVGSDRSAFSGALDEITLYEGTTLWPTAIAAIYQNGKCRGVVTPPLPGLIAWWPLENEPGYVNDIISGNNAIGISQHDGRVGEAFELPAVAPLIFPSSSSLTVPSAFTVEAWVWDQSLGSFDNIFSKANDSGQYHHRLMLNSSHVGL